MPIGVLLEKTSMLIHRKPVKLDGIRNSAQLMKIY